jgi:hypothetical protein
LEHQAEREVLAGRDDERKTAGFFSLQKGLRFIIMILLNYVSHLAVSPSKVTLRDAQLQAVKVLIAPDSLFLFQLTSILN